MSITYVFVYVWKTLNSGGEKRKEKHGFSLAAHRFLLTLNSLVEALVALTFDLDMPFSLLLSALFPDVFREGLRFASSCPTWADEQKIQTGSERTLHRNDHVHAEHLQSGIPNGPTCVMRVRTFCSATRFLCFVRLIIIMCERGYCVACSHSTVWNYSPLPPSATTTGGEESCGATVRGSAGENTEVNCLWYVHNLWD